MNNRIRMIALAVSMVSGTLVSSLIVRADEAIPLNDQLRKAQTEQERLRTETAKVGQQLDEIIGEFKSNGLEGGTDVKTLIAVRGVLNKLTEQEMGQVIQLLQQARGVDPQNALHDAAQAHAGQNNIITQLQTLLKKFQQQQAISDLAERLGKLADQQSTNIGYAVQTVRAAHGQALNMGDPNVKDALQVQASTQTTLQADVQTALNDLSTLLQASDGDDADRIKKSLAMADSVKVGDLVGTAAVSIQAGTLIKAAGEEKTSRDTLRNMSRLLGMPQDTLGKLKEAAKEIDGQIAAQKEVTAETKKTDLTRPEGAEVEHKQADVVDNADLTRKDLDNLAPAAADDLKKAEEKMQQARADINTNQKDPAGAQQKDALAQLQEAKQDVADQITKAEQADADANKDNLEKLQDLKKETEALKKDQDALKTQTAAAKNPDDQKTDAKQQDKLEQKAQDIKQRAADASPAGAQKMGEASDNMDKAKQNLDGKQPDNTKATDQQQNASDNLAKAAEAMDKDIKQLEQDKKDEDKLAELREKLEAIIAAQVDEGIKTGLTAAKPKDPKALPTDKLAGAQDKIGTDTDAFKQALPDSSLDAAAPLTDAKGNMDGASGALNKANAKTAIPLQKVALVDLYKALEALDKKIADLQQALGQQPDQNQDLAKQLEQMQQELAQAQGDLNQPTTQPTPQDQQQAVDKMTKEQQEIAKGLQQMEQNPPKGTDQQELQDAQKAADDAAQDLQQGNLEQAGQDMQKAEQGMQEAQQDPAGKPEAGKPEAGKPEAGKPEAGHEEAGHEAGKPEAGGEEAGKPEAGQGLPQLAQKQQELQKELAQQLAQDPATALDNMAEQMDQMAAAQQPEGAQQAMQDAQQQMADAAQQAQAGNDPAAQADAAQAQADLAQAQAAMGMAAGPPGPPHAGPPDNGPPDNDPGNDPGMDPAMQVNTDAMHKGSGERKTANATGATDPGHRNRGIGAGNFINLPARDRAAIQQANAEKYPQAYGPMVEQYLRNLSEDDDSK